MKLLSASRPGNAVRFDMRRPLGLAGLAGVILLWQFVSSILASLLLPGPFTVAVRATALMFREDLLLDLGVTLIRVSVSVGLGFTVGVLLGVLCAHLHILHRLLDPLVQLLRPISPFAWTPLVILIFGLGNQPVVFTILVGVLPPALVIAFEAVRAINPDLRDIARIFGVSGWTLVSTVELPLIRPELLAAARVLFGVGWILATGAEMLAANSGLGYRLMNARYLLDFPGLYALILVVGVTGLSLDRVLRVFGRTQ
ncbi:MAG: ABC transporter permease [candidate division WOR-3 bacterium]